MPQNSSATSLTHQAIVGIAGSQTSPIIQVIRGRLRQPIFQDVIAYSMSLSQILNQGYGRSHALCRLWNVAKESFRA
jgi:hypothetical protein